MNAGLTNLDTLRKHLLAGSLGAETKFDTVLTAIGLGVAGMIEGYCNRKLAYAVDDLFITDAARDHLILPRYPVVELSALETRLADSDAWEDAMDSVINTDAASGMVRLYGTLGNHLVQLRATYTGGYWFSTAEPDDATFPETMPEGATALPDELKTAFLLQCENVWQHKDRMGTSLVSGENATAPKLAALELVPLVRSMLGGFIRYSIT